MAMKKNTPANSETGPPKNAGSEGSAKSRKGRRKPTEQAVALSYEPGAQHAPKVVAKGSGQVAAKIIEIAREHNIHIHSDPDLVAVLAQLELNEEIPADLYVVVAELLAFVYGLNRQEKLK